MIQKALPSAVPTSTYASGVLGVLVAYVLVNMVHLRPLAAMSLLIGFCALPMWWIERRRVAASRSAILSVDLSPSRRKDRVVGSAAIVGMSLAVVLIQLNFGGNQVSGLIDLFAPMTGVAAVFLVIYLLNRRGAAEPDSLESLGIVIRGVRNNRRPGSPEAQVILAWLVKLFFLPLMLTWLYTWLSQLDQHSQVASGAASWFVTSMAALYAIDTLFGTIGYLSTSRSIDAQIRSTDATWLGWLSALACYPPLNLLVLREWFNYKDGYDWLDWLGSSSTLSIMWGAAIILLTSVYVWATVVFGPRFSNLTNRGIITSGPFRFTKHPAYISKNLSWWMISIPFVSAAGVGQALISCAALVGVNLIYWLRAKTEERHLMSDPAYRQYAAWIAQHGIAAKCRELWRHFALSR